MNAQTPMNPIATVVLGMLKDTSPEDLYMMYRCEMMERWSDTRRPVRSPKELVLATHRIVFLESLYDSAWVWAQHTRLIDAIRANPKMFMKERAPEGMPQWEFDLLSNLG